MRCFMDYDYKGLIITLRNKLVMSQEEFAKLLGVSFASVNRWEKGHFEPTIQIKKKIIQMCKDNDIKLIMEDK